MMKILKFFDYCFYRCAYSKFAQKLDKEESAHIAPAVWIILCQSWNIITIIMLYYIIIDTKFDFITVYISIFIPLALVNALFLLNRKKYEELRILYKDEKNKKLKGWGVVLYIIFSFLFAVIAMIKLFWVPKTGWH
jgi:hydrogenase-4 membrane subunit HyfE